MSLIPPSHREGLFGSDSFERISQRIRLRQDSPENWLKNDPVLEAGEFGYEVGYPTGKLKIGTGSTRWSQLPYLLARGPAGAAGPAGPPGKGIQIKGTTDVWPPATDPKEGDLWLMDDPVPAGAPAGTLPGDGFVWTGTKWSATGPIRGPAGEDGKSVKFSTQATAPTDPAEGDLWLDADESLNIWDGTQWMTVTASGGTTNIVSTTEPPPGTVEGELWINPDGIPPEMIFSNVNPPVTIDTPATESGGEPLGVVNGVYIEPDVIGGVPVMVAGKRYLLPLIAAPAGLDTRSPLFTFADEPIRQQLDGSWIGFDDTGLTYYQPDVVGGIPVLVAGKRYLLPIIAE